MRCPNEKPMTFCLDLYMTIPTISAIERIINRRSDRIRLPFFPIPSQFLMWKGVPGIRHLQHFLSLLDTPKPLKNQRTS